MVEEVKDKTSVSEESVDLTETKDGGVLKKILRAGTSGEKALSGDTVIVHYVGTLESTGEKFDSSRDRGEKFEFKLGAGEVIKAWDLGVSSMEIGELAVLTCKSEYAYGENGSPPKIPPNSTLIFEVELFGSKGQDLSAKKDNGIIRRKLVEGEGYETPNDGGIVNVNILGKVGEKVFDERHVKYTLGEGTEDNIPEGIDHALEKFNKGEKSRITLLPKYGFGSKGCEDLGVPGGATLTYEVELVEFEKAKSVWEMDQVEKIDQAKLHKEKGTAFFKDAKYRLAIKQYKKICTLLDYDAGEEADDSSLTDEQKKESASVLLAGRLNLAVAYLKLSDWTHAKEYSEKALETDPENVKALFRKAQALQALQDPELAIMELQTVLKIEPDNRAAGNLLQQCQAKIKHLKQKEKQLYAGMFDKFASIDKKKEDERHRREGKVMEELGEWEKNKESEDDAGGEGLTDAEKKMADDLIMAAQKEQS